MIAAPIMGFLAAGCGDSNTTFTGVGGSGTGGTSTGGSGGDQGGSGGTSAGTGAGGSGGSAAGAGGAGGSSGTAGSGGSGGSGGTAPELGYEPVGLGDPWFFSSAAELEAFEVELTGATGSASWNEAGEVHLPLTFTAAGDKAVIHFSAPWDAVANALDPIDLTHRVLKARARIANGATASGGVQGYSQSSAGWTWVSGDWNDFGDLGGWRDVEFDFDTAASPDEVMRFGLQVYANGAGSAELILDDLRLEPKPAEPVPDGGVPEADAGGDPPPLDGDAGVPDAGGGLGYTPIGIGDPWLFDTEAEMSAFEFAVGGGGSESHAWSNGEIHITATIPAAGATVALQFTTPWNGTTNASDLSGRVLRSRVRIADGATGDGGVQLFAQSGGWQWTAGDWNGASSLGSATDVQLPLTSASDATSVQRFGLQFYGTAAGTIELIVDDFRIEPAN